MESSKAALFYELYLVHKKPSLTLTFKDLQFLK